MRTLEKELCYTAEHSYGYQWGLGSLPSQVFTVVNQLWRDQSHFRCLLQCSCSHLRAIDRVPQQRWVGRLCSHKPQCCVGQHAPMLLCGVRAAGINCETATIKCVSVQLLWHWSLVLWSYRVTSNTQHLSLNEAPSHVHRCTPSHVNYRPVKSLAFSLLYTNNSNLVFEATQSHPNVPQVSTDVCNVIGKSMQTCLVNLHMRISPAAWSPNPQTLAPRS